jgi:hypothetical protein
MQFHHRRPDARRRLDLRAVVADEQRHPAARVAQRRDEIGQPVFVARHVKPAFGRALLALFGHDADRMRAVAQGDGLHFGRCRHLEVQRHRIAAISRRYRRRDMAPVLAQMRGDAVGPGLLASSAARTGSGKAPPRALRTVATWSMLTPRRVACPGPSVRRPSQRFSAPRASCRNGVTPGP